MTALPTLRLREGAPTAALEAAVSSPVLARVLAARNITDPLTLDRTLARLLDPSTLLGVDAAAALLSDAIARERAICVIGDYDADGATSTALAISGLRALGARNLNFIVPDRVKDGYGLGVPLVERAGSLGAEVLVTVDNGTSSIDGVARARELGMDVLVTDHHLPGPTLPAANVLVNPNIAGNAFASKALAGVGVMFYVLLALRALRRRQGAFGVALPEPNLADWLDLVALGTVADVVPLDANNRVLVHQGLLRLRAGRARPGLRALLAVANRTAARLTEIDLAFAIAPRLNAAGRLADMTVGVRCLLAATDAEASVLAHELDSINIERRSLSERMTAHALDLLGDALGTHGYAVCLHDQQWHEGVIGIVAGRLREASGVPAFAFADAADPQTGQSLLKGSGRSIEGVNLRDALYEIDRTHPGLLLRFGGHAMAAGVTLTPARLQPFRAALNAVVRSALGGAPAPRGGDSVVDTDGVLADDALSLATAQAIAALAPWGSGFPAPRFHDDFEVVHVRALTPRFFRIVLRRDGRLLEATSGAPVPAVGSRCRVLYGLEVNRFRDSESLQLRVDRWWPLPPADAVYRQL